MNLAATTNQFNEVLSPIPDDLIDESDGPLRRSSFRGQYNGDQASDQNSQDNNSDGDDDIVFTGNDLP